MNDWEVVKNTPPDSGMHTEYKAHKHRSLMDIKTVTDDGWANSICLANWELFHIACQLPEIRNLIKWAFNVRETMSDADLFVHGEEALKPFEGREE